MAARIGVRLLTALLALLLLGQPPAAQASPTSGFQPVFNTLPLGGMILVNSTTDAVINDSLCTLREAIIAANTDTATSGCSAGSGVDEINLTGLTGSIDLFSPLPAITTDMVLDGPPSTTLAVRRAPTAQGEFSLFTSQAALVIEDLTLQGGRAASGGAIFQNGGSLTLERVTLSDNRATSSGGAVFIQGGQLTINDNIFSDNRADSSGGAIYAAGSTVKIRGSALFGNQAGSSGGGLFGLGETTTITNSTFDGNSAASAGGGVFGDGTFSLRNVTLTANQAARGGGIARGGGAFRFRNTLIAGNTGGDCTGTVESLGYNLVQTPGATCTITGETATLILNQNPLLDPLAVSAPGRTHTRPLKANSPAFNTGTPAGCEPDDQRGIVRPQGTACDIGAYELSLEPVPPEIVPVDPPISGTVLRGRVMTDAGVALPNVKVSLLNLPQFGSVLTHADGSFSMVADISGTVIVQFEKSGYLVAQRSVEPRWQDYVQIDDIALIPLDRQATEIELDSGDPIQVARGSVIEDSEGERQATLLIPSGTTAQIEMPDGSMQPLDGQITIRATEFTVGENGPEAMPGELPTASGYTYALEYTVDEALAEGAVNVEFSQPIFHYVENFLDFPVGSPVPVGYYDRQIAAWVPSENGRVIKIISITEGKANIDSDGDDVIDTALGLSDAEREQLATLYQAGQTLWRVPIKHFTPWDCNWPFGPPDGATGPNGGEPQPDPKPDDPCKQPGSIIECESQVFGENIPLVGTDYTLVYRSDRVPGREAAYTLEIPLTGATLPPGLKRVEVEIRIAGRKITNTFSTPQPNQSTTFTWDGLDAFGRPMSDGQQAFIRVGFVYDAVYYAPSQFSQAFALFGSAPITGSRTRQEITIWQETEQVLAVPRLEDTPIGGWNIDVHHRYDTASKTLYLGYGDRRSSDSLIYGVISTIAGTGTGSFAGDGGQATAARVNYPAGLAAGVDGSLYIADFSNHRIRRIAPNGVISTVAGTGIAGYNGDGIPALQAHLNGPNGVAVAPDGSLIVTEALGQRVRRIAPNGIITTIAGTGATGDSGDGGLAVNAQVNNPNGPVFSPDGNLYFADTANHRIRQITANGYILTIAGTGVAGFGGDDGSASAALLNTPSDVTVGADGTLYIADRGNHRVRRIGVNGVITTVAGNGTPGFSGDNGNALLAQLSSPDGIAIGSDGSIYIADGGNQRIRMVGVDGIISTYAGTGTSGYNGDNRAAGQARINDPNEIVVAADGAVLFADSANHRIRRIAPGLPGIGANEILIPSSDASLVYVFSAGGQHLRTVNALTGTTLLTFGYNPAGRLTTITDANSNITTIERDAAGHPTGILSPYNQRTTVSVNASGFLQSVTNPAAETYQMGYTAKGLMTLFRDPRNNNTVLTYDTLGRLTSHLNAANGLMTIARTSGAGDIITHTTPLNRTTTYNVIGSSGGQTRVNTFPSGLQSEQTRGLDGSLTIEYADGTMATRLEGSDPRWGMLAPTSGGSLSTPGGQTMTVTESRTANLTNPANPFSLTSLTETASVNGRNYTSIYNAASRTFTLTTPVGRGSSLIIDTQGRPVSEQVTGLAAVTYTYDSRGRMAAINQSGRVISLTYNAAGFVQTVTDPLNRVTSFTYDAAGRVLTETLPGNRVIQYAYDASGNVTSLTPPGRPPHSFTYNALNQVTAYTPPDVNPGTDATTYTYNADRQPTQIALPDGRTIGMSYDSAGRVSGITIARGSFTYTYNPTTGMITNVTAPGGVTQTRAYDGGLLLSETISGTVSGSISRTYDNSFRTASISVNGANPISYSYDNDSLPTAVGALSLSYNAQNGLLTGTSIGSAPNTVTDAYTYSTFAELASYNAAHNATQLYNTAYSRDALGRITQLIETIGGVATTYNYTYDDAGRLTQVQRNGATVEQYTYDANGNRLTANVNGAGTTGVYDNQDRVLSYGGATFTYNANGDLISRVQSGQTTSYSYDELGSLLGVTLPGGAQVNYLVDAQGRRIQRTSGGNVRRYLWESRLRIAAELDSSNTVVSRFVYGTRVNVPDYMIQGANTYRIITDQLGSVRLVVDVATGAIVQRMDYDSWGNVTQDTNPGFQPFGYAGGLYDAQTGLVRFGARDYDPRIGRWTTKDPIGFMGGNSNLYVYVGNDPVNVADPTGLIYYGATVAGTGSIGPLNIEFGVIMVYDPCTGKVRRFPYFGLGLGFGFGGALTAEATAVNNLDSITGWGGQAGAFAAAGPEGMSGAFASSVNMNTQVVGAGYATGAGAGIGVMGTYTWEW